MRRVAGLGSFLTVGAVTAAWLASRPERWLGVWAQTAQAIGDSMTLTGPAVAGVAAIAGVRFARSGTGPLATSSPRSDAVVLTRSILTVFLPMAAAVSTVAIAALVLTYQRATVYAPVGLVLVTVLLALLAFCTFGYVAGRRFAHPAIPLLGLAAAYYVPYQALIRTGWSNLVTNDQLPLDYVTKTDTLLVLQIVWFASLTLFLASLSLRAGPFSYVAGSLTLGAALALHSLGTQILVDQPWYRDAVCDFTAPEVCTTRVHAYLLPQLRGIVDDALRPLDESQRASAFVDPDILPQRSGETPFFTLPLANGNSASASQVSRTDVLLTLGPDLLGVRRCPLLRPPNAGTGDLAPNRPVLTTSGELLKWYQTQLNLDASESFLNSLPPSALTGSFFNALSQADADVVRRFLRDQAAAIANCDEGVVSSFSR